MTISKKKKYPVIAFISIIVFFQCTNGQNLSTSIKVQAMDMATALMKNDFASFSKFMHPNIISYAGGKEELKSKLY